MTEGSKESQPADEQGAAGKDGDGDQDGGTINDPLTRRDVEAPRVRSSPGRPPTSRCGRARRPDGRVILAPWVSFAPHAGW
jgi:hypothetical protein